MKKKAPVGPALPGKKSFHKHLAKAIDHNSKSELEQRKHVKVTYKKLNGRTVKRKVTPYAMKGNVLVGFDHKRKATRSFRMERVVHMEKTAAKGEHDQVIMYHAGWCGPCQEHKPIVRNIARGFPSVKVSYANVDHSDSHSGMAEHKVKTIPHVVFLKDGKKVDEYIGRLPPAQVQQRFQEAFGSSGEKKMASAFWQGFEKKAETSDDETRMMLYHHAGKKKKGYLSRLVGGVAAGAGAGALLHKKSRKDAVVGGAVLGGLGGLYAAHRAGVHNAKREKARDFLLTPEGPDKDKTLRRANPDRLFSPYGKRDLADARSAAYAEAQRQAGGER